MSDSDERYSRVEREILEILDGMETNEEATRPAKVVDFRRSKRKKMSQISLPSPKPLAPRSFFSVTPARLLIATVGLALAAIFVQDYSGTLATIFVLAAIASFLAMFFVRSGPRGSVSSSTQTKRWRGRDIDLGSPPTSRSRSGWRKPWRRSR